MGQSKETAPDTIDVKDKGKHPCNNGAERFADETREEHTICASNGFINDSNNEVDRNRTDDSVNETNLPEDPESTMDDNNIEANVVVHIESAYPSETPVVVDGEKYDIERETRATKRIIYTVIFLVVIAIIVTILFVSGMFSTSETIERKEKLRSLAVELSGESSLNDPMSPQAKALNWLQNEDQISIPVDQKFRWIQRYASAVVLHSFTETTWMNASRSECDWNQLGLIDDALVGDPIFTLGLHCENNVTTSHVNLWFLNMSGTIASEIGYLTSLRMLFIGGNPHLVSTIPTEIGKLTNLNSVSIANTSLTGDLPTQMKNMQSLQSMLMYSTNLTGKIEPMCDNPSLRFLSTDCGNGTSKPVYPCVTQCCNPDKLVCCNTADPDQCISTEYKPDMIF